MPSRALKVAPNLSLPLDAVTSTFAIIGKRGAGKTNTSVVMVEQMLEASQQVVVTDPTGVWWGLRTSADGLGAGYPVVILGGEHGDLPLEKGGGEVVADLVIEESVSVVLDLSLMRKGEARSFLTGFVERLYHANRDPLHFVVDECDLYAGQRPPKGGERLLGAMEDIVRRGRVRGIGTTLISQRPAVIHKDVLTQAETLIAHRLTGPQDRKALDEWVRYHGDEQGRKQLLESISSLPVGTAWVWSPGWLDVFEKVAFRERTTFDSSATPKVGERVVQPKGVAEVDLDILGKRMAEVVERAERDDPKKLHQRIRELERQVAKRPDAEPQKVVETVTETVTEYVEVAALTTEERKALHRDLYNLHSQLDLLRMDIEESLELLDQAAQRSERISRLTPEKLVPGPVSIKLRDPAPPPPPAPSSSDADPDVKLKAGARRMLEALARPPGVKLTRSQVATLAKMKVTGGSYSTYLSTLRTKGLVVEEGDHLVITDAGLDALGEIPPAPRTTEELLEMWKPNLKGGAKRMLDALVDTYPRSLTRAGLADAAEMEPTGGSFSTYLSILRTNGLAEVDGDEVRASDTLFTFTS